MLVDFALGLLHSSLKKGTLGGQSPATLALLDPMLPLLIRALRSRHANSVSLALKCLAFLIRLPLPGTHTLCPSFTARRWARLLQTQDNSGFLLIHVLDGAPCLATRLVDKQCWLQGEMGILRTSLRVSVKTHSRIHLVHQLQLSNWGKDWPDRVNDKDTGVHGGAGLAGESGNAGRAVTRLLQRMSKTGDPIAQDCFKLLATLMRESETYQPNNAQLRFLLTWAFSDMEESAGRQAAFGLLKVSLPARCGANWQESTV